MCVCVYVYLCLSICLSTHTYLYLYVYLYVYLYLHLYPFVSISICLYIHTFIHACYSRFRRRPICGKFFFPADPGRFFFPDVCRVRPPSFFKCTLRRRTALMVAADKQIVELLRAKGAEDPHPLITCTKLGDVEGVRARHDAGDDVNAADKDGYAAVIPLCVLIVCYDT